MHYAPRAAIFPIFIWYIIFFNEALLASQKLENEEIKLQISVWGGEKLKKNVKGVTFTNKTSLNFFLFMYAIIFDL